MDKGKTFRVGSISLRHVHSVTPRTPGGTANGYPTPKCQLPHACLLPDPRATLLGEADKHIPE